ncbi:MAG TPA: hypothetical protein VF815_42600 [Myxococcaceae bacterium]|jgi:hypothetical protein
MAVSAFRALVAAHVQAGVNRAFKELSKAGLAVMVLVVALMGLSIGLPIMVGGLLGGWHLGSRLPRPDSALVLGLIATVASLVAGVVNGLVGASQHLAWESYRSFPVPSRTLLLAELLAGLASLEALIPAVGLVSLMAGLSIAQPGLLPLHLPMLGVLLSTLLLTQYLAANLTSALARRHRAALLGLFGLCALLALPVSTLNWNRLSQAYQQALLESLGWLPAVAAMRGLGHALKGSWGQALALQLPSLLLLGVLAGAALLVARRENAPPREATPSGKRAAAPGWRFRSPTSAIARLQWVNILASQQGKVGLVMPLFSLFLVKVLFTFLLRERAVLTVPTAITYLFLVGGILQFNQFGLDGHGVKTLLLLPLSSRELLVGKALGCAAYAGLQCALLLPILWLVGTRDLAQLAAGLLFAGCLFLVQNAVGQRASAWMPRKIPLAGGRAGPPLPFAVALLQISVTLGSGALFSGLYLLLAQQGRGWLLAGMALALALCGLAHALLLPHAADYLRRRQDTLVQVLG